MFIQCHESMGECILIIITEEVLQPTCVSIEIQSSLANAPAKNLVLLTEPELSRPAMASCADVQRASKDRRNERPSFLMHVHSLNPALTALCEKIARMKGQGGSPCEVLLFRLPELDHCLPEACPSLGCLHKMAGGGRGWR